MTAPTLESLIEATLRAHWRASVSLGDDAMQFKCECGVSESTLGAGYGNTSTWLAAHQARAVRAAISEATERALFDIEGKHHIHGIQCLCGFESHRSRSRTEHITGLVREALTLKRVE